jgi:hypothetical protein
MKERASEQRKGLYENNPELRWEAGKANRGKKFSAERIEKMHGHRTFESYSQPHTEETKKKIGAKSAAKWTPEYKKKHHQTMVERGYWIAKEDKTDWEVYFKEAQWPERMFDYCSEEELDLLRALGVWHMKNNRAGLVRDHKYSRRSGFKSGVFAKLIRHPVNCQLITHSQNTSKAQSKNRDSDDQTLEELFDAIEKFELEWFEQEQCLNLIKSYEQGERWERITDA